MQTLNFDDVSIPVLIKREKRKSLRFKYVGSTCHINAPSFLTDEQIIQFCDEKRRWLVKNYERALLLEDLDQRNMILGKEVELVYHLAKELSYELIDSHLHIYKSNRLSEASAYSKVKDMMAFDVILPLLSDVLQEMNLTMNSVNLRVLKASWGRCNSKKDITLSTKLIERPLEFIRYVCVHECAHLKEMNHSKNFWTLVENYCPDYKSIRKQSTYTL